MQEEPILVSICSLAYNHEPYIRQCLEGFVMQKTNFKFEVLINDDASSDKTADIIREYEAAYPDIIKPIYQKENQYSRGVAISATYLYPIARGKYIAKCEGDDYWTDPLKLQKQVDFLEENKEYSLCVGGFIKYNVYSVENEYVIEIVHGVNKCSTGYSFTLSDTRKGWIIKTLTAVFRNDKSIFDSLQKYKFGRSVNLFCHI